MNSLRVSTAEFRPMNVSQSLRRQESCELLCSIRMQVQMLERMFSAICSVLEDTSSLYIHRHQQLLNHHHGLRIAA